MTIISRINNGASARSVTPMTIQIQGTSMNQIFLPDVVLDIVVARDMGATQGMAAAQDMGVGLYMVAVMVVMDLAVAPLFLLNMLVIWRLVCPKLFFCKQLSLVVNK